MKKFEMTKDWCLAMAEQEGTSDVGAGWIARDPDNAAEDSGIVPIARGRLAFGRLINLLRRRKQYSIEQLAHEADVELDELMCIEEDLHYKPHARAVYRIASTFGLSQQKMMELAGLATARDSTVREAAMRFAARSESVVGLTPEERSALNEFLADLSEGTR